MTIPKISLVIPIYNEESVLGALFARLKQSLADLPPSEILFVNDGSTDDSLAQLTRFLEEVPETKLSRRAALARLGLAATAAYVAPSIMHIDRSANAFVVPSPCSSGRGRRRRRCKTNKKKSK